MPLWQKILISFSVAKLPRLRQSFLLFTLLVLSISEVQLTDQTIPAEVLETINQTAMSQPFHRDCELRILEQEPGRARVSFAVNDYTANMAGVLHGGILYAMLDVACFTAVSPTLHPGERVVSHDTQFSVLSAAPRGSTVFVDSRVDKRGRKVVFSRAEAWIDVDGERKLIGTGNVTKSVIQAPQMVDRD